MDTTCPACGGEAWWHEAASLHCCIRCAAQRGSDGQWYIMGRHVGQAPHRYEPPAPHGPPIHPSVDSHSLLNT